MNKGPFPRFIRQFCRLALELYTSTGIFPGKLRANPVLGGITLSRTTISTRYTACADDVSMFVKSTAEIALI